MRDYGFFITAETVAKQQGITLEEAKKYIKDLVHVGSFMAASNGETIEILPPNPDSELMKDIIDYNREYYDMLVEHRPIMIQRGEIQLKHVRDDEVYLLSDKQKEEWERIHNEEADE